MFRSTLFAAMVVFLVGLACATVGLTEVNETTPAGGEQKSILSYLEPGQRLMYTRFDGGLVRLEVVSDDLLAAEKRAGKSIGEWPAVKEVTSEFVILEWNTEERTATQILPESTILEVWFENDSP